MPFENLSQIRVLCVSPDGALLVSIDMDGRALLINRKRQVLLHHFSFKKPVACAKFSPDGRHLAVAVGRLVQVWQCPSLDKQMSPMALHRTYGHCHADVLDVAWSPDGAFLAAASKDITLRVFSLDPIPGYEPPTLAGHKDALVGVFFAQPEALQRDAVRAGGAGAGGAVGWVTGGKWYLSAKHYFHQRGARVSAYAYHPPSGLLAVGLSGGVFDLYQLPDFSCLHTLSIGRERITSLAFNHTGDWLAVGCASLGQLLVWEWRSETYVLKQQGHHHDVAAVAFSPDGALLATGADDCKVLAAAMRPDGRQLAAAALDGSIYLWDPVEGELQGTIEGRRDLRGGRLQSDRRSAANAGSDAAFTSLAYSADGALLLAGGKSKYVCVYDVSERLLLRRFQLSHNRALDGVLDVLNSKKMTDAGPLQLIDHQEDDEAVELLPPTTDLAASADVPGSGAAAAKRPPLRCRCVALSPTGRCWAAASTEGVLLYGLDEQLVFDPTDLTEDLTPAAARAALAAGAHLRAALIALRLGDAPLLKHVLMATPPGPAVAATAAGLPAAFVPAVLAALAEAAAEGPHLEFVLSWVRGVCVAHGAALKAAVAAGGGAGFGGGGGGAAARLAAAAAGGGLGSGAVVPVLRSLQKVLGRLHADLAATCESNLYGLQYLTSMAAAEAAAGEDA
ncbi:hypothetical protein GPECTOR_15g291 [Gonium pectorale]|uniref:Small-subunit processome Utp12 domain-containing protein n=1 Tax=Gonium pectorale TaxID=33097 RepID=A0A150GLF2_GONPE|nr:hypothetical protein GPECTOR_15g291 [Gonium pectorale]|eukprot:KXZ50608.1 hypothetical protein GPECTOR_15g291 [Gonium pectorale]